MNANAIKLNRITKYYFDVNLTLRVDTKPIFSLTRLTTFAEVHFGQFLISFTEEPVNVSYIEKSFNARRYEARACANGKKIHEFLYPMRVFLNKRSSLSPTVVGIGKPNSKGYVSREPLRGFQIPRSLMDAWLLKKIQLVLSFVSFRETGVGGVIVLGRMSLLRT